MDPVTISALAGSAVSVLSSFLRSFADGASKKAGSEIGESAGQALADKIRDKFKGVPEGAQTLAHLERNPDSAAAQVNMQRVLEEAIRWDSAFAASLSGLIDAPRASAGDTTISGGAFKGPVITSSPGSTFNFGDKKKPRRTHPRRQATARWSTLRSGGSAVRTSAGDGP